MEPDMTKTQPTELTEQDLDLNGGTGDSEYRYVPVRRTYVIDPSAAGPGSAGETPPIGVDLSISETPPIQVGLTLNTRKG